tara:strand:- start:2659 stop:3540 length:882 start_codon:yes stop_codon:yes gene_type:complete
MVRDGGVIISELVPGEVMDEIREEVQRTVPAEEQQGSSALWPEGNNTVGGLAAVSPMFVEKLLVQPKVLEAIDAVLKPNRPMSTDNNAEPALPLEMQELEDGGTQIVWNEDVGESHCHHYTVGACVMLEIGAGRADHQFLHRENAIYQPFVGRLDMREFIVSTMWAGTDFTPENGATRVVPGSHLWPEARLAKPGEITQAVMKKGSVLLWLSRTLHGAAKSTAKENRTGFFASYIADWIRQEENQYIVVPEEIAKGYSQRARQIIGYRSSPSIGWAKGRNADNLLEPGHSGQL